MWERTARLRNLQNQVTTKRRPRLATHRRTSRWVPFLVRHDPTVFTNSAYGGNNGTSHRRVAGSVSRRFMRRKKTRTRWCTPSFSLPIQAGPGTSRKDRKKKGISFSSAMSSGWRRSGGTSPWPSSRPRTDRSAWLSNGTSTSNRRHSVRYENSIGNNSEGRGDLPFFFCNGLETLIKRLHQNGANGHTLGRRRVMGRSGKIGIDHSYEN
jgi:hypothetical protein